MTSSMMAGERRFASARRGGMTVLGKVPKPLNLPSQRLENHGLDPNVEIVPKGTLSWGSRSSSSAPNAWGSSSLSPSADGGTGSPSHLSGRPSSGGSGTRPSTAGSDKMHEPASNAWGPNSRPSSASGALTSNQTSLTSLRPRSAEMRPGSSQLSRFAEPSSDSLAVWGSSGVAEKLGVGASKTDGFSLSSGDFPTLGSDRDNSGKSTELQDHGTHARPSSSSGRLAAAKEKVITSVPDMDVNGGTVNHWKKEDSQHIGDGVRPSNEKWQGDPQQYRNANIPPQHFDSWRGPPLNAPGGGWFGGAPGGPPYGPVPPGGFPVEPFHYYRPQMPPPVLAQPGPPPNGGPRGHHPKNGDMYRPQMPDAYLCPGMPIRPGFYPGPVAYEGYYGPPMGYDRDVPFMGMPAGPSVYNRYQAPNAPPDPSHTHGRGGGRGSGAKGESVHSDEARGPYKVLKKQQSEWNGKEEEVNQEHNLPWKASSLEKGNQSRTLLQKNEWGADHDGGEDLLERSTFGESLSSQTFDSQGAYSKDCVNAKPHEKFNRKTAEGSWTKKTDTPTSSPEVPKVLPAAAEDSSLIQKIGDLNAKARSSDGRHDVASSGEERKNRSHDAKVKAKSSGPMIEVGSINVYTERTPATRSFVPPISHNVGAPGEDKTFQPIASGGSAMARRPHDVRGRVDNRGKGRFNAQDSDGWRKKPLAVDSPSLVSVAAVDIASNDHVENPSASEEAADKQGIDLPVKDGEESLVPPMLDSSDSQAQRLKMRELAIQRSIQRQKEEEEREREQKAKAQAKLEELNRRTQLEKAPPTGAIWHDQDESKAVTDRDNVVFPIIEGATSSARESAVITGSALLEMPNNNAKQQHLHNASASAPKASSQVNDISLSKHKHTGDKQNRAPHSGRDFTEKTTTVKASLDDVASANVLNQIDPIGESSLPGDSNTVVESSVHQRKKYNRNIKNKRRPDDVAALPSPVPTDPSTASSDIGKPKASSQLEVDPSSVQLAIDAQDPIQGSELNPSLPGRVNNQWKSQNSRRMPRNPQPNKQIDKFHSNDAVVWAPVRLQNKPDTLDEAGKKHVFDDSAAVQNNSKGKRAEIERYVAKGVAKELAQQESVQQPILSLSSQNTSDDNMGEPESGVKNNGNSAMGNVGSALNGGNSKQNRQVKGHGSWRQRNSVEASSMGSSSISNPNKNTQKGQNHLTHDQPNEWNTSDGWNSPDTSDLTAKPFAAPVSKGKRHPFRGHTPGENSQDPDDANSKSVETSRSGIAPAAPVEINPSDRTSFLKENRGAGERTQPQWQPKAQAYSARSSGGQTIKSNLSENKEKDITEVTARSRPNESLSETAPNMGNQETRRERKAVTHRGGRPYSPNQPPLTPEEQAPPVIVDNPRHEQRFSSGFRKNGNQNNRSGRGHEFRGDWSYDGPPNRERQRQTPHYEYQPIGPNSNSKLDNYEGPGDGSGSRYRERGGQGNNPKRGGGNNFYGRQSRAVRVDAGEYN